MLTVDWIENYLMPGDVVWDIGANVGAYSLLIASKFKRFQSGIVYAFEPESSNFYGLNRNILENHVSKHIVPLCIALSDSVCVEKFYLSSNIPGAATHGLKEAQSDGVKFKPTHVQGAFSVSGDYLVGISPEFMPNHIKIDVDGTEDMVITGIAGILANPNLKSILIEISDSISMGSIEQIILCAGFTISGKEIATVNNNSIHNYLFVRYSPK
jgi:FkbM family methyltransferase